MTRERWYNWSRRDGRALPVATDRQATGPDHHPPQRLRRVARADDEDVLRVVGNVPPRARFTRSG